MERKAARFWYGTTALIPIVIMLITTATMTSCSSTVATSAPPSPEATKEPTNTLTPMPTPTMTPTPSPTITPTPLGGSGVVLLDLRPDTYDDYLGIFALDVVSGEFTRVTDEGYALEAVSPGGDKFLVSQSESLLLAQLNESEFVTVAQNFLGHSNSTRAYWLPGTDTVVFLGKEQGKNFIYSVRENGTQLKKITQQGAKLYGLANTHSSNSIMWHEQDKNSIYLHWHKANMDGSNQETLKEIMDPVYSPTGDRLAYMDNQNRNCVADTDLSDVVKLTLPIEVDQFTFLGLPYLQWIRGGENLLVYINVFGGSGSHHHYFIYSASGLFEQEAEVPIMMSGIRSISPDGLQMIFSSWEQEGNMFFPTYDLYLLDLLTYEVTPLDFDLPEDQVYASMMWLY